MAKCNTKVIEFSRQKRRKIQADFNGGKLTSDSGALMLRQVGRKLALIDAINACICRSAESGAGHPSAKNAIGATDLRHCPGLLGPQ